MCSAVTLQTILCTVSRGWWLVCSQTQSVSCRWISQNWRPFEVAARENFPKPSARRGWVVVVVGGGGSLRHIGAIKSSLGGQQAQVQRSSAASFVRLSVRSPSHPPPPADRGHSGCLLSLLLKARLSPADLVSPLEGSVRCRAVREEWMWSSQAKVEEKQTATVGVPFESRGAKLSECGTFELLVLFVFHRERIFYSKRVVVSLPKRWFKRTTRPHSSLHLLADGLLAACKTLLRRVGLNWAAKMNIHESDLYPLKAREGKLSHNSSGNKCCIRFLLSLFSIVCFYFKLDFPFQSDFVSFFSRNCAKLS